MEPKDKDAVIETKSKEKKVLSMDSAIKRLEILSKTTTITGEEEIQDDIHSENTKDSNKTQTKEDVAKISALASVAKENKDDKKKNPTQTMQVDYNLNHNDLDANILNDETLSEAEDAKFNKRYAWLAYILFFIPLLINRKSPFIRMHANEGLDVFIIDVFASILMICGKFINFGSKLAIIGHLMFLFGIGLFALTTVTKIFQIIRVFMGKKNQTPWLWKTRLIK